MPRRFMPVLLLALLGIAALVVLQRVAADDEDRIEASGTIEATELRIAPELGGRVLEVAVEEGDEVLPGELLLRLDASLLEAQLTQARASLEVARAVAETALAARSPQTRLAAAQLVQAEASVSALEAQIDRATLRAPITATVMTRAIEPGEVTLPGATLLLLGRLDQLRITVYVPEDRYGTIDLGDTATLSVDAYEGEEYEATVEQIAEQAEFTPRNVQTASGRKSTVYALRLSVDDDDGDLKPGMPADLVFDD